MPPRQEDGNENIWNQSQREIAAVVTPTSLLRYKPALHHLAQLRRPTRISVTVASSLYLALIMACILAVERGINLCAPIHDALFIEAPIDQIDAEVARLMACMSEASEAVLGGDF